MFAKPRHANSASTFSLVSESRSVARATARCDNRADRPGIRRRPIREDRLMLDGDDLALWCALNRLMATYWSDVDENGGLQAHEFYLPEGLFTIGNNRFEGKEKIEAF